jgi:hypothetical protein
MKNVFRTVVILLVTSAIGCAGTHGRELPLGSLRELEFSPLPEDVKLLYVLNAGAVLSKPEISVIYGTGFTGLAIAGIEEKYSGATRGSMFAAVVGEEPGCDLFIWFSPRPIPFASGLREEATSVQEIDGVKAFVSDSGGRQEWDFLPAGNVLVSAESEKGAHRAASIVSHVYSGGDAAEPLKKWRRLFRPLSGRRVMWGRLCASGVEDLAHFKKYCEGLYLIAGPLLRTLPPQHVSFALALEGFEAELSFAFARSSPRELKKAVRACECAPALKEALLSAPVSSDGNGTLLTIRSNLRDLASLVESLYDQGEEDEEQLEYPKEILRTPPPNEVRSAPGNDR